MATILQSVQEFKQQLVRDFYQGACTECSCGHTDKITKLFIWQRIIGYNVDEDGYRDRIYEVRRMELCSVCFALAMRRFINKVQHVPYLRGEGDVFVSYVNELRSLVSEEELCDFVWSEYFRKFDAIVFEEPSHYFKKYHTVYCTDYYKQNPYGERLLTNGLVELCLPWTTSYYKYNCIGCK